MTHLAVSTQYRRVTDRQTVCHSIVRAMHTHRAVKIYSVGDPPPKLSNRGWAAVEHFGPSFTHSLVDRPR